MSELLTVVEGKLLDPNTIEFQGNTIEVKEWRSKAAWQYLRFVHGYKRANEMIKALRDHLNASGVLVNEPISIIALEEYFKQNETPLQFIIANGKIVSVATLKHILFPPDQVYAAARRIAERLNIAPHQNRAVMGAIYVVEERLGMRQGIQIYAGDLITDHAIRVSSFSEVIGCLNPLSWLGSSFFDRFNVHHFGFDRIVRIRVKSELEKRLEMAIKRQLEQIPDVEKYILRAKKFKLSPEDARAFALAFGSSFKLGRKVIQAVMERFEQEHQSFYGLAQAFSWVAKHGELRKTPEGMTSRARQNLSTIAASLLILRNPKAAKKVVLKWLKDHIKEGRLKTYEELVEDLNLEEAE